MKPVSRSIATDANAVSVDLIRAEPADAHHVPADRRRQHVADELAGEGVRREGAEPDPLVEGVEHPLPAPGRQHDAGDGEEQREGQQDRGVDVVAVGDHAVEIGGLDHEDRQHADAHDQPEHDLPPCRTAGDLGKDGCERRFGRDRFGWRGDRRLGNGHRRQPREPPVVNRAAKVARGPSARRRW